MLRLKKITGCVPGLTSAASISKFGRTSSTFSAIQEALKREARFDKLQFVVVCDQVARGGVSDKLKFVEPGAPSLPPAPLPSDERDEQQH